VKFEKRMSDSAGTPWEGREFSGNSWAQDDGSTPPELAAAIAETLESGSLAPIVAALRTARLLVPLVAQVGESAEGAQGLTADKSADLSIVAVATPDGQSAIPAFSSVEEMQRWRPDARPVPIDSARVAVAAVSEGHTRVVLNPTSVALGLRTPALAAIAQQLSWLPPEENPEVRKMIATALEAVAGDIVSDLELANGDPTNTLQGPELLIKLTLEPGLDREGLSALLAEFAQRLQSAHFNSMVDSLAIKVVRD
jgi:hypothetical protein